MRMPLLEGMSGHSRKAPEDLRHSEPVPRRPTSGREQTDIPREISRQPPALSGCRVSEVSFGRQEGKLLQPQTASPVPEGTRGSSQSMQLPRQRHGR